MARRCLGQGNAKVDNEEGVKEIRRQKETNARRSSAEKIGESKPPRLVSSASPLGMLAVFLLEEWRRAKQNGLIFLAESEGKAEQIGALLYALAPACGVMVLPRRDTLPFEAMEPSREITGRRASVIRRLAGDPSRPLLVATAEAITQRVAAREYWIDAVMHLRIGDAFAEADMKKFLDRAGYTLNERVEGPGSALFQGQVVELFPAGSLSPVRVETNGAGITGIRCYDLYDPTVTAELNELVVDPVSERPPIHDGLDAPQDQPDVRLESLFDYLPSARLVTDAGVDERGILWLQQIEEEGGVQSTPQEFLTQKEWNAAVRTARKLPESSVYEVVPRFFEAPSPTRSFRRFLADKSVDRILLTAATEEDLRIMDRRAGGSSDRCKQFNGVVKKTAGTRMSLIVDFDRGFIHHSTVGSIAIVTAFDVLGSRASHRTPMARLSRHSSKGSAQVATGDVIVHFDRGVAVLRGLESIVVEGAPESEMIRLEFADSKTVLVPVEELASIWRYSSDPAGVKLDKADGSSWLKRRAKVERDILETAAHIQKSVEGRARQGAPKIVPPVAQYERFANRFLYFPTADQASAIEDVLRDLASGLPMDRIVCGDVGFGKTEVALRAAAAVVFSGKQVAVAVPTTVLARQHVETFRRRFAPFGIDVGHVSRFASRQEVVGVKKSLSDGSLKLVIGTHALGAKGIAFANLGLVIVDEEQRFGVADKAKLSALKDGIHLLTMTATPIPRTLSEAHGGIRSVSLIVTPPVQRIPVRTILDSFRESTVAAALRREKSRKGQSLVVCPRIRDIGPMQQRLHAILPELRLATIHGRMRANDIDEAMIAFSNGSADVLLATNIIENGLDLPRANTIVIWRPEKFGLAQLHQLRGRVGRGSTRAFAYLLTDPDVPATGISLKRLKTLQELNGPGAGFDISDRDLDLRGGGDLLSEQQSGHVKVLGTALYKHLLTRAVAKGNKKDERDWVTELRLEISGRLPETYVQDIDTRVELYARLFKCTTEAQVDALQDEIEERFGGLPPTALSLLSMARIRADCRRLGVLRIEAGPNAVALTFHHRSHLKLKKSSKLRVDDSGRLVLDRPSGPDDRLMVVEELIDILDDDAGA
jgi:transcription-repair coupling factor (superfamily II helicase)